MQITEALVGEGGRGQSPHEDETLLPYGRLMEAANSHAF